MSKPAMVSMVLSITVFAPGMGLNVHASLPEPLQRIADSTDSNATHVETFTLESKVFSNSRTIRVFLPETYHQAGHEKQEYPVLYLNDGFAVFKQTLWNAPEVMTRLVRERKIPEIILVGIDNGATAIGGSPDQRTNEYLPYSDTTNEPSVPLPHGNQYPEFLLNEVMPAVIERYRVKAGEENTGIGGSSYGALAALYTVIHCPGAFGYMLLESTPTFVADQKIMKEAELLDRWPRCVYIGIGTKETPNEDLNRTAVPGAQQLRDLVMRKSAGTRVKLLIGEGDSHNARSWSRRLPQALMFLFGSHD